MLIHIINGTYGHYEGEWLKPKSRTDPPFEVDDAEAERLVALGVAEIVNVAPSVPASETARSEEGSNTPAPEKAAESRKKASATPEYSEANTVKELTAICEQYGVELTGKPNKKAIIEALDLFFSDEEAPPEPSAAMPE